MGGHDPKTYQQPDARETERFWTKIWLLKKYNVKAEWINNMTREQEGPKEGPIAEMNIKLLKKTLKIYQTDDGIYGFWFKKFTSVHDRLALEMNRYPQDAQVPDWMAKVKTALIQKDPSKRIAPHNYRPITCLPMMWKILTAQIKEKIYYSLISRGLFPNEQKGCEKDPEVQQNYST